MVSAGGPRLASTQNAPASLAGRMRPMSAKRSPSRLGDLDADNLRAPGQAQRAGASLLRAIADVLNARGVRTARGVKFVSYRCCPTPYPIFRHRTDPRYRDHVLNSSGATTKSRPTDRELNFGADRADHCRQEISRTPLAPAVQCFRMQPACHRRGPQVDRCACSSG